MIKGLNIDEYWKKAELKARVLVLDKNPIEKHEANEAARHLADRFELRFGFSDDEFVLDDFDEKH